ncbi:MAG TPA: hypothetical protein VF904_11055 [Anaeromyxobacteraceae bacterium]
MIRNWSSLLAVAALAVGCNKQSSGANLTVSAANVATMSSSDGGTVSSSTVTVKRIRIVVRKVSFDTAGGGEERVGPFLVDLSGDDLGGGVHTVSGASVAPGTFCDLRLVINTLPAEKAGGDAGLLAMAQLHASIAVDFTIGGDETVFTFKTPMELKVTREGAFTVSSSSNLTLNFDALGWFTALDGKAVDPRDPANRGLILANIRKTFGLFPDDDRCGEDRDECECREDDEEMNAHEGPFAHDRHMDGGMPWSLDGGRTDDDDGDNEDHGDDGQHGTACMCKVSCQAPDAGAADAGAPDAGAPDAGAPDAGAPDAGAPTPPL